MRPVRLVSFFSVLFVVAIKVKNLNNDILTLLHKNNDFYDSMKLKYFLPQQKYGQS